MLPTINTRKVVKVSWSERKRSGKGYVVKDEYCYFVDMKAAEKFKREQLSTLATVCSQIKMEDALI